MLKYKVAPKVMCILHYVLKFSVSNETAPFLANSSTYHTLITEKKTTTLSVSYYSLTSVLAMDQNNKRNLHNCAICLHMSASLNVSEFLELFTDDDRRYTKPVLHVKEPNINTIHTTHCIFFICEISCVFLEVTVGSAPNRRHIKPSSLNQPV